MKIIETPTYRSNWKMTWLRFRKHKAALVSMWILGFYLVLIVFGDFISPHSPFKQYEGQNFSSIRMFRFADQDGKFSIRPYINTYKRATDPNTFEAIWTAVEGEKHPVQFFVKGFEYRLLGFVRTSIHLFGTGGGPPVFPFGSDSLGRCIFSRTVYACRISLSLAFLGVVITIVISVTLGGISGYYGGVVDDIIQRISELLLTIPKLPLWMALAAAVPTNWPILKTYLAIVFIASMTNWPHAARGIRSKLISLKGEDYIQAARSYGTKNGRIIFSHLMPNIASYIIVAVSLGIPGMIIMETSLSFLGIGLRKPAVSWGVLLQEAQNFQDVIIHPWLLIPGIFVVVSIVAFNFIGDGLRSAVDPYQSA